MSLQITFLLDQISAQPNVKPMKIIFRIITIVLCMSTLSVWSATNNEKIEWIKKEYKVIRSNLNRYIKKEYDFLDESAEGAGAIGYVSKTIEIKLIEVTYYGETGKSYFEFYYSKNKTFFIFEKKFTYNTHFMMTEKLVKELNKEDGVVYEAFDPKKTKVEEWRYYFNNSEVVKTLGSKGNIISDSSNAKSALKYSLSNYIRLNKKILVPSKARNPGIPTKWGETG